MLSLCHVSDLDMWIFEAETLGIRSDSTVFVWSGDLTRRVTDTGISQLHKDDGIKSANIIVIVDRRLTDEELLNIISSCNPQKLVGVVIQCDNVSTEGLVKALSKCTELRYLRADCKNVDFSTFPMHNNFLPRIKQLVLPEHQKLPAGFLGIHEAHAIYF